MQTSTVQARDELLVTAEVVSRCISGSFLDDSTQSEVVIAANALPVLAAFITNCEGSERFQHVAQVLRDVSVLCAKRVNAEGLGHLIRNYP